MLQRRQDTMDSAGASALDASGVVTDAPAVIPPTTVIPADEMIPRVPEQRQEPLVAAAPKRQSRRGRRFMFATGIECSCPVVGNGQRVDQMQSCGHYEMWEKDIDLVNEL